jgi:hypothetical protein
LIYSRGNGGVPGVGISKSVVVKAGKEHTCGLQLRGHIRDYARSVAPGFRIARPIDDDDNDVFGQKPFFGRQGRKREYNQQPKAKHIL